MRDDSINWPRQSVNWLKESAYAHHLAYATGDAVARLRTALLTMKYLKAEHEAGLYEIPHDAHISTRIAEWSESDHREMLSFLRGGGYSARKALLTEMEEGETAVLNEPAATSPFKFSPPPAPTAGKDDRSSLEDAVLYGSPEAGSW